MCGVLLGGAVWCEGVLFLFFSQLSSFSFSLSLLLSCSFLILFCLPLSLLSSILANKTLCKALINKREHPSLLLSPPSSLPLRFQRTKKKERGLFITGIFPARNLFFITVLNKFQKLAAGENYSHYSFK